MTVVYIYLNTTGSDDEYKSHEIGEKISLANACDNIENIFESHWIG